MKKVLFALLALASFNVSAQSAHASWTAPTVGCDTACTYYLYVDQDAGSGSTDEDRFTPELLIAVPPGQLSHTIIPDATMRGRTVTIAVRAVRDSDGAESDLSNIVEFTFNLGSMSLTVSPLQEGASGRYITIEATIPVLQP